jgi:hypothetical protein
MSSSDFQDFLAFQKFMAMKTAVPAAKPIISMKEVLMTAKDFTPNPSPPSVSPPTSIMSSNSGGDRPINGFNYNWLLNQTFTSMRPWLGINPQSKHPGMFWLYKHLYEKEPEKFKHISDIHMSSDGRTYFSVKYITNSERYGTHYTVFHIFGKMYIHEGKNRFLLESVDIMCGGQDYHGAAFFNK